MSHFVKVARMDEIHELRGTLVTAGGEDVVLFRRDGRLYAVNNICAHQHFSMLHKGEVDGYVVTCPMHGWSYDMRTGNSVGGEGRVATYEVKIENGDVFLEFPGP